MRGWRDVSRVAIVSGACQVAAPERRGHAAAVALDLDKFHRAEMDFAGVQRRISAWLGHATFGDTWKLRRKLFGGFILVGAERSRSARGFVEQQHQERPGLGP
jgi:hypothetical protein